MGWEEMEVDTTDFLQSLEKFSRDPDGSIQGLPENLLAIGRIPSGVGDVHGVEENLHNHLYKTPQLQTRHDKSNQQKMEKRNGAPASTVQT